MKHPLATLEWLGCTTFRLRIAGLTIMLDAYIDKSEGSDGRPGFTTADVNECDYILIGHSHWDHIYGAEKIAPRTGAKIIGSYESIRMMSNAGVAEDQLWPVAGGETIRLSADVSVKVFPTQHSCLWAGYAEGAADVECLDGANVGYLERRGIEKSFIKSLFEFGGSVGRHMHDSNQGCRGDGGAFCYIIETPEGRLFFHGTLGHWLGVLENMRADVAIMACSGRPQMDGEPWMGTLSGYLQMQAVKLGARRVILCHHDAWLAPAYPRTNITPAIRSFERNMPGCEALELDYTSAFAVFSGLSFPRD